MGTRFLKSGVAVVACLISLAPGAGVGFASGPDNVRVSRDHQAGSYTRYDGASDATMTACSTGKRAQDEPSVAVNPHNTNVVVAGSNDYCAALVNGDVWSGYYRRRSDAILRPERPALLRLHLLQPGEAGERFHLRRHLRSGWRPLRADRPGRCRFAVCPIRRFRALPGQDQSGGRPDRRAEFRERLRRLGSLFRESRKQRHPLFPLDRPRRHLFATGPCIPRPR